MTNVPELTSLLNFAGTDTNLDIVFLSRDKNKSLTLKRIVLDNSAKLVKQTLLQHCEKISKLQPIRYEFSADVTSGKIFKLPTSELSEASALLNQLRTADQLETLPRSKDMLKGLFFIALVISDSTRQRYAVFFTKSSPSQMEISKTSIPLGLSGDRYKVITDRMLLIGNSFVITEWGDIFYFKSYKFMQWLFPPTESRKKLVKRALEELRSLFTLTNEGDFMEACNSDSSLAGKLIGLSHGGKLARINLKDFKKYLLQRKIPVPGLDVDSMTYQFSNHPNARWELLQALASDFYADPLTGDEYQSLSKISRNV